MYAGFAIGAGPNDGWFNYVPNAARPFNPGLNIDFYALGMIFLGISTTVGAANFVVTFLRMRAPGMSINRVPIMIWGTLTASAANLLVVPSRQPRLFNAVDGPPVRHAFLRCLARADNHCCGSIFSGCSAHPWVYVVVLPAMGMVSDGIADILPPAARRLYARRVLDGGNDDARLRRLGAPHVRDRACRAWRCRSSAALSIIITVPSAVAVFAWIATIWLGRPVITTAFLFFASMIVLFVIGGVSGFMTASVPVDWQMTDTYFVVAHIHYVLIGINVFPVAGRPLLLVPEDDRPDARRASGQMELLDDVHRFNLAFLPMHLTGLFGMPRRVYTYPAGMGWSTLNMLTSIGAFVFAFGVLLLVVNIVAKPAPRTPRRRQPVGCSRLSNGRCRRRRRLTISPSSPRSRAVTPYGRTGLARALLAPQSGKGWCSIMDAKHWRRRHLMVSPT